MAKKQQIPRAKTPRNLYDQKHETFAFDGIWYEVFGEPQTSGLWLIYGAEKHGKTWFALKLAKYLSQFMRTVYISAEEGTSKEFVDNCERAGISHKDRLNFYDYLELPSLEAKLRQKHAPRIVFLDNVTMYSDELKGGVPKRLVKDYPRTLFVWLAHEERKEVYTAQGKLIKKLAKAVIRVEGLRCHIGGRVPGGVLDIDWEQAALYHGQKAS